MTDQISAALKAFSNSCNIVQLLLMKYSFFVQSKVQAEVGAPISNGHFVGAPSTVNNDQLVDEDDPLKTLPEGSLKHAVYSVVMVHGREGISREDLLSSLYSQTKSAMLADDWEDDVKKCLKSLDFVKVQGQYILRSQLLNHPCSRRSHAKGKERVSEIGSHQLDCEGEIGQPMCSTFHCHVESCFW